MNESFGVVSLKCTGCGAVLDITPDHDVFSCSYCGARQIVRRSGGTVSLKPLEEAISRVQQGTDLTAAELAVRRLREDMATVEVAAKNLKAAIRADHYTKLPSKGGRNENEIIVAFIPEVIGSGVSIYDGTYYPVQCSGVGIISPTSETYGHGFPVLDEWVHECFKTEKGSCVSCGAPTAFGHPVCHKCYEAKGRDWRNFL